MKKITYTLLLMSLLIGCGGDNTPPVSSPKTKEDPTPKSLPVDKSVISSFQTTDKKGTGTPESLPVDKSIIPSFQTADKKGKGTPESLPVDKSILPDLKVK